MFLLIFYQIESLYRQSVAFLSKMTLYRFLGLCTCNLLLPPLGGNHVATAMIISILTKIFTQKALRIKI